MRQGRLLLPPPATLERLSAQLNKVGPGLVLEAGIGSVRIESQHDHDVRRTGSTPLCHLTW